MKIKGFILVSLMLYCFQSCYYDNREDLYPTLGSCEPAEVSYLADIIPIMEAECYVCHNNNLQEGNVNLEGFSNIKLYVNNGSLYGSIVHDPAYSVMPPGGQKINACSIEKIRTWIEAGAPEN